MIDMLAVPWKICRIVRRAGLRGAARVVRINLVLLFDDALSRMLDFIFNVDTRGVLQVADLDVAAETRDHGVWYEPTPWFAVSTILRKCKLKRDLKHYVFVDFGSGKGRALVEAARFPFGAVTGVEFSSKLCAIAEANLRSVRFLRRRAAQASVRCLDASLFDLPPSPCILYFYNPFDAEIMRMIANRVEASYAANPRDIIAAFYARNQDSTFRSLSFMTEVDHGRIAHTWSGRQREYSILRSHVACSR